MKPCFEVDDYYELLVLYKAVMLAKFHPDPIDPIISGSPFIELCLNRMIEVLAHMEIERGNSDKAKLWKEEIVPDSPLWNIALSRLKTIRNGKHGLLKKRKVLRVSC